MGRVVFRRRRGCVVQSRRVAAKGVLFDLMSADVIEIPCVSRHSESMSTQTLPEGETVQVIGEHIAIKPGHRGGKPHIAGHRIKVQHIAIWHERMGMTPAEIVATYPSLTLSAVHAALAYYYAHRAAIDADTEADERLAAELRAEAGPSALREKLNDIHGTHAKGG